MTIKPLAGYLLIEPKEAETKTASGIILPESATEKPQQGTVVAVGDSIYTDSGKELASPVKKGDVVIYKKWGGDEIKIDGKEMKIVKFDDLMALVEEKGGKSSK
jgi:chaperonin GroES